jgi:hypothetical protein
MPDPAERRTEHLMATSGFFGSSGQNPAEMMARHMRETNGPFGPDQAIRQAILNCWRMLPEDRRGPQAVEAEVRRLMDRALREFAEDAAAYGFA